MFNLIYPSYSFYQSRRLIDGDIFSQTDNKLKNKGHSDDKYLFVSQLFSFETICHYINRKIKIQYQYYLTFCYLTCLNLGSSSLEIAIFIN